MIRNIFLQKNKKKIKNPIIKTPIYIEEYIPNQLNYT